jgi:hypothetical protein
MSAGTSARVSTRAVGCGRSPAVTRVAQVAIEITGIAWSSDPLDLPADTRQALETDGRTELLKVLDHDDPPRVIHCGLSGCSYPSADAVGEPS